MTVIEKIKKYTTKNTPTWCPGCGDFAIWQAFRQACQNNGWDNTNTVITAGIGCHGHMINYVDLPAFEGLHGRALPVAQGIKLANHKLNVFVFSGDGDSLAEGGNHFLHACRRNVGITVILHDNSVYGLTTGQTSPRSQKGYVSSSTPEGSVEEPLHPETLAITSGANFVARCYSGDIEMLERLIVEANSHPGFALITVLQPCVTFNKINTHIYYQKNVYHLDDSYDPTSKVAAFEKSLEWGEKKIPVGVLYKGKSPSYESQLSHLTSQTLVADTSPKRDISSLLEKYKA